MVPAIFCLEDPAVFLVLKKRERNRFPKNNKLKKNQRPGTQGEGGSRKRVQKKKIGKKEERGVIGSWSRQVEGGRERKRASEHLATLLRL